MGLFRPPLSDTGASSILVVFTVLGDTYLGFSLGAAYRVVFGCAYALPAVEDDVELTAVDFGPFMVLAAVLGLTYFTPGFCPL